LKSHPAVIAAMDALASLQISEHGKWLSGEQARNIITVEITYHSMAELIQSYNYQHRHKRERPLSPLIIMGIRYYIVDHLPNDDDWRVLNALGVN